MKSHKKLYCYVDETGQDTTGEFFLVSVVIVSDNRDALREILQKIEKVSGKGIKKWTKATRKQRKAYIEKIVADQRFAGIITFSHYKNSRSYVDLSIFSTAKSILAVADDDYDATVYVDGLQSNQRRKFAAGLRKLHVHVNMVRGLTDQSDEFIRLADAMAGFIRDALEKDEGMMVLYRRARKNNIVCEI